MNAKEFMKASMLTMAYIITIVGSAGLLATGVYMLNSFMGFAVDALEWRYGLVGILYIIGMMPSSISIVKAYWGAFEF